ncbi:MAG TPA: hypothetical protein VGM76_04265 [Lacipirellulaceae bacterium]|jgi:hypothetical protein
MSELLQEFVDCRSQSLRIDRAAGVIRGVKLLGLKSRNGRRYQETALAEAVSLYEGAKVNVNHPKGHPLSPRDYQDRLGIIRDVQHRPGDGLFGDLHFNPKHILSEQLMWDAEHASQNVGLSHNVLAKTSRQGDETVVEAITTVQSIDLVADPASTHGLFEQHSQESRGKGQEPESSSLLSTLDTRLAPTWDALTVEQLELHRPDLLQEFGRAQTTQLAEARSQLDALVARDAASRRRERVTELLQEHNLPLPNHSGDATRELVSRHFMHTLMSAPTDEALRRLVEERSALVRSAQRWDAKRRGLVGGPVSRDQVAVTVGVSGDRISSAKEFVAAICGA